MISTPLYPLHLAPLFEYRPWGGRRLANWLETPLPDGLIGEAWLLSDRQDHPSRVASGPLQGQDLHSLLESEPLNMMGSLAGRYARFPLLLKFLDVRDTLSVQVHPSDAQTDFLPKGESGKTEAWVVLEANPTSLIYAGLKRGTTKEAVKRAVANKTLPDELSRFMPKEGDAVYVPAGTVHSLGDVVVFEVQQNSDVTFRLSDWDRVDAKTGKPRALQVTEALACIDVSQQALRPVEPVLEVMTPVQRELLLTCEQFRVWRIRGEATFNVVAVNTPRVVVCTHGCGSLEHDGNVYAVARGDVVLLPAIIGVCVYRPRGASTLLEVALPVS